MQHVVPTVVPTVAWPFTPYNSPQSPSNVVPMAFHAENIGPLLPQSCGLFVTTPILLDGFNNFLAVSYSASDSLPPPCCDALYDVRVTSRIGRLWLVVLIARLYNRVVRAFTLLYVGCWRLQELNMFNSCNRQQRTHDPVVQPWIRPFTLYTQLCQRCCNNRVVQPVAKCKLPVTGRKWMKHGE